MYISYLAMELYTSTYPAYSCIIHGDIGSPGRRVQWIGFSHTAKNAQKNRPVAAKTFLRDIL